MLDWHSEDASSASVKRVRTLTRAKGQLKLLYTAVAS